MNHRNQAEAWGRSEGLSFDEMGELRAIMRLAMSQYIPKSLLCDLVQIDSGSFGRIYRSDYEGAAVAVKEIGADGQCGLRRRMREIFLELRILVQVKHPNVVGFWGVALDFDDPRASGPSLSLVFELCEQGSLHKRLYAEPQKAAPLSPPQKVAITAQVAAGIAYLHAKCILHRDLTPHNILLTDSLTAKIADFGCARFLSEHTGTVRTSTVLGTPAYMAPEQLAGAGLTAAVDVWALATIMWELASGQEPWRRSFDSFDRLREAVCGGMRLPLAEAAAAAVVGSGWPPGFLFAMQAGMETLVHLELSFD